MNVTYRAPVAQLAFLLSMSLAMPAGNVQEPDRGKIQDSPSQGRKLFGNYMEPAIREIAPQGDAGLDGLIRDGRLPLTADDAIRLALENNLDISVERYTPYFTLWGIDKGRSVLNPTLSFASNIDRQVTPAASLLQGGETVLNLDMSHDFAFQKPFETGTDIEIGYSARRTRTNNAFFALNPSITSNLSFNLTQHLLKDFGRTSRGRFVRIARNNYTMSEEDFVARVTDVVSGVLATYWDLVFAEEDIKVKEASKRLAEVVLQQNRLQAETGTMAELDVIQAEAEVATREEQLVVARFNRRIAEDQLKVLISSRQDPGTIAATIEPASPPEPPAPLSGTVEESIRRAVEGRPEVKRQIVDNDNRNIQVKYSRNQLLPTLDFTAGYSMNGLGGDRIIRDTSGGIFDAPIIAIYPGGFWDSLDSMFSRRYLGYFLGITLRLPIGNDEARANSAQAKIDLRRGEEQLRSIRQRVALEVRQAWENIEMDRARVRTAEVTVRYSERKLQGEQDKYSMGATTTRFILEAQRDLQDAQSRLLKARIDLIKSRVSLEKAAGDTFAAHGIELASSLGRLK